MNDGYRFQSWFVDQWSRVALPCAIVVVTLLPVLANDENQPLMLLVTLLPVYMIHQYEEHAHGRFIAIFDATVGDGLDVLTQRAAFWINIVGVWLLFLVSFYLARFVALEFAPIPVYLTLVNGVIHLLTSVHFRRYNPGLWTSLILFLPWGGFLLRYFNDLTQPGLLANVAALLFAVAVHAAIVVYALRRRARLRAEGKPDRSELAPGR